MATQSTHIIISGSTTGSGVLWTASEHLVAARAAPDTVRVHVRVCRRTYVCMYVCVLHLHILCAECSHPVIWRSRPVDLGSELLRWQIQTCG